MKYPRACSRAHLTVDQYRSVEIRIDQRAGTPTAKNPRQEITPLELMTTLVATCSALSARSMLELEGDAGDIEVTVTQDAVLPTCLHRQVQIGCAVSPRLKKQLIKGLEESELAVALFSRFVVDTVVKGHPREIALSTDMRDLA